MRWCVQPRRPSAESDPDWPFSKVAAIAGETGHTWAQIALAWTLLNSSAAPPPMARAVKRLEENLGALAAILSDAHARLERVSAIELGFPHDLFCQPLTIQAITGESLLPR